MKAGDYVIVEPSIGNTEPGKAEWGGLEGIVLYVHNGMVCVGRNGRSDLFLPCELKPSNHRWVHGRNRCVDGD